MKKKRIIALLLACFLCGNSKMTVLAGELLSDTLSSMLEKKEAAKEDNDDFIPGKWYLCALGKTMDTLQEMEAKDSFLEADHYCYTLTLEGNEVSSGLWQLADEEKMSYLFIPTEEEAEEREDESDVYYSGNLLLEEETKETASLAINMEGYYLLFEKEADDNENASDKQVPFEESEIFQTITELLDTYFSKMARHYVYNEEDNTVYAYVRIVTGLRNMILQNAAAMPENWKAVLDEIVKLSERISAATTLATRDGFLDTSEAHCTIMIVDEVNDEDEYYKDDVIAIVTDGEVTFDLLDDALNNELPS